MFHVKQRKRLKMKKCFYVCSIFENESGVCTYEDKRYSTPYGNMLAVKAWTDDISMVSRHDLLNYVYSKFDNMPLATFAKILDKDAPDYDKQCAMIENICIKDATAALRYYYNNKHSDFYITKIYM